MLSPGFVVDGSSRLHSQPESPTEYGPPYPSLCPLLLYVANSILIFIGLHGFLFLIFIYFVISLPRRQGAP